MENLCGSVFYIEIPAIWELGYIALDQPAAKNYLLTSIFIWRICMSKKPNRVGGVAVDQLKSIIGRVEKLEEEKSGIAADIRDVFAEAKGSGFDVKAIRQIIKLRKLDAQEMEEQETILDTYRRALGMLPELDEAA